MNNGEKPIANPYVVLREEFDDWAVLYDPDTGRGFGLSPTGVYLWKLLDGEQSIDEMLAALRRDAQGVPEEAGAHIVAFVEELTKQSLAGWEGERVQDCRGRRIPSCPACAGTMKFNYEPPRLVNLGGGTQALGYPCGTGSQNTSSCGVGNGASMNCGQGIYPTGGAPCDAGTGPTAYCCGGNVLSTSNCYNGDHNVACCQPGTVAGLST